MRRHAWTHTLALTACLTVVGIAAAARAEDLSWIAEIPGVGTAVQDVHADEVELIYSVAGDLDEVMDEVLDGLTTRGWRVRRSGAIAVLGGSQVGTIKATRGSARLHLASMGTSGAQSLVLRYRGGSLESGVTPREPGGASLVVHDESTGDRVTLRGSGVDIVADDDDRATLTVEGTAGTGVLSRDALVISGTGAVRTIRCEPGADRVVVGGTGHRITLKGECDSVNVGGTDNEVWVRASIERIGVTGVSNRVGWDPDRNVHDPRISRSGLENRVYRMSR